MQIEISEKLQSALEKAAAAAGMSVSGYANLLVEESLESESQAAEQRMRVFDELMKGVKDLGTRSGRDGRGWREFIHEGHPE